MKNIIQYLTKYQNEEKKTKIGNGHRFSPLFLRKTDSILPESNFRIFFYDGKLLYYQGLLQRKPDISRKIYKLTSSRSRRFECITFAEFSVYWLQVFKVMNRHVIDYLTFFYDRAWVKPFEFFQRTIIVDKDEHLL